MTHCVCNQVREFRDLMAEKEEGHERLGDDLEQLKAALMAVQDEAAGAKDLDALDKQLTDLKSQSLLIQVHV